jgi:regulator of sigma E protease
MSFSDISDLLQTPWAIALAIFFLCASIFIHELGHFLAARWRGLVVERFSIGLGPRLFGWTRGGVDYRVSAIPLGGYVALPQLAGVRGAEGGASSYDADALPPLSVTDKVLVSLAGPIFNILFALLLCVVLWMTGLPVEQSLRTTSIGYVAEHVMLGDENVPGPAWEAGLRTGDTILAIDGTRVNEWTDIVQAVATSSGTDQSGRRTLNILVTRDGEELTLVANPIISSRTGLRELGILPLRSTVVGEVYDNSPAEHAGIQAGDRIVAVDGSRIGHVLGAGRLIASTPPQPHTLTIERGDSTMEVTLTPELVTIGESTRPLIGITWAAEDKIVVHDNPFRQVYDVFYMTVDVLRALVSPSSDVSIKDMSGPVSIAHALFASAREGFAMLLFLVMFININLAIVNLLPIPVLDGGHIAFALVEKIRGKPVPAGLMAASQVVFMILLLSMMAYITLHDISREIDMAHDRGEARKADSAPAPVFGADEAEAPAAP